MSQSIIVANLVFVSEKSKRNGGKNVEIPHVPYIPDGRKSGIYTFLSFHFRVLSQIFAIFVSMN